MLPEDSKAHCDATSETLKHSQVDDHFTVIPEEEKLMPYSDEFFKEAAIQWLIETDQVSFCFFFYSEPSLIIFSLPDNSSIKAPHIQTYDVGSFMHDKGD